MADKYRTMLLSSRSSSRLERLPNEDGRSSILFFDNWQYRSEHRLPNDSGSSLSRFWPLQTVNASSRNILHIVALIINLVCTIQYLCRWDFLINRTVQTSQEWLKFLTKIIFYHK